MFFSELFLFIVLAVFKLMKLEILSTTVMELNILWHFFIFTVPNIDIFIIWYQNISLFYKDHNVSS